MTEVRAVMIKQTADPDVRSEPFVTSQTYWRMWNSRFRSDVLDDSTIKLARQPRERTAPRALVSQRFMPRKLALRHCAGVSQRASRGAVAHLTDHH